VHAVDVGPGGVVAGGLSGHKEKLLHADVDLRQVRVVRQWRWQWWWVW
jgi:hypothetical protein